MTVWPLQKDCNAFYGNPGDDQASWELWERVNLVDVKCPWVLHMDKEILTSIRIHKACASSLTTVLGNIWDKVGRSQPMIEGLKYDSFSGSYNQRPMRGGTSRSMHGFGAALDFDYDDNLFHSTKHSFADNSLIVTAFKAEGAVWGGDWSPQSIDAMHFQFARVR